MVIVLINKDLHYNCYLEADMDNEDPQELLAEFKQQTRECERINYAPEYFISFLKQKGIEARQMLSTEVVQLYWGG